MNNIINHLRKFEINRYNKLFKYQYLLRNYNGEEWKDYINFENNNYGKKLVHRDDNFEIKVLSWKPGDKSGIHNHSEFGCLMKVLQGNLQENIYSDNLNLLDIKHLSTNEVSYIDNTIGYHSINNNYNKDCISLHIYSPCLHNSEFY
tara:strand:+ start:226 stop:666 length:441 start_codon:yes stop_codon:yes gene_type:complete